MIITCVVDDLITYCNGIEIMVFLVDGVRKCEKANCESTLLRCSRQIIRVRLLTGRHSDNLMDFCAWGFRQATTDDIDMLAGDGNG